MEQREFDKDTAKELLELTVPDEKAPDKVCSLYKLRDDGVYRCEGSLRESPRGEGFYWTPSHEIGDWPKAPNPLTAPMLPIPFTPADLAAFMLDGVGYFIPEYFGVRIGEPLDESELPSVGELKKVSKALKDAFALAENAQRKVGAFDYEQDARLRSRATELYEQAKKAHIAANENSATKLKEQAKEACEAADKAWRTWRGAMVKELLYDRYHEGAEAMQSTPHAGLKQNAITPAPVGAASAAQRQAQRWQKCIDAGLQMPQDTYSHFPRGIGRVAKKLNITRQGLRQDLNAHRERLFGK